MAETDRITGLRILVVEDEALIAEEIQDRLTRLGVATVAIADSADQAMQAVRQHRPDLVLMDIRLKGPRDGIEVAGYIREQLNLPVVFITAHSDQATLDRAKNVAPFGYVLKPFQERELLVAIEMATHMHSMEEQVRMRTAELEKTVLKLKLAFAEIKTLRGLLPLCAWCKRIRDGADYWHSVENYLRLYTDAQITHGICPECFAKSAGNLESGNE